MSWFVPPEAGESEAGGRAVPGDAGGGWMGTADDEASRSVAVGPGTASVRELFGERLPVAERFVEALVDQGVVRGLLGPREVPRLWERHVLNSASVAPFLPESGTVVDLGSGAGLPGVVLACLRPDLTFVLVEPMLRRTTWLHEVVGHVGLANVEVRRARAEDLAGELVADVVTARAVAPLDRLAAWALPLCRVGGSLIALKGGRAQEELESAREQLAALGGDDGVVVAVSAVPEAEPTSIVQVRKVREGADVSGGSSSAKQRGPRGRDRASTRRRR